MVHSLGVLRRVTNMTDILMSLDVEVFIHIFFWILIIFTWAYPRKSKNKIAKFFFFFNSITIILYTIFIQNTILPETLNQVYPLWFIVGIGYLIGLYEFILGIIAMTKV